MQPLDTYSINLIKTLLNSSSASPQPPAALSITRLPSWNGAPVIPFHHEHTQCTLLWFSRYRRKTPSDITSARVIFSHSLTFPDIRSSQMILVIQLRLQRNTAPGRNVPHTCKLSAHKCFPSVCPPQLVIVSFFISRGHREDELHLLTFRQTCHIVLSDDIVTLTVSE